MAKKKINENASVARSVLSDMFKSYDGSVSLKFTAHVNKKIVSCPSCAGTGWRSEEKLTDYHRREYSTFEESCDRCDGRGRLTETTKTMTFYPNSPVRNETLKLVTTVPYEKDPIESLSVYVGGGTFTVSADDLEFF